MKQSFIKIGFILLVIAGLFVLANLVIKQKNTYDAVTLSEVVKAGESNETSYHTRIFVKSKLLGSLKVEGGDIYFQIKGYNVDEKRYMNEKIYVSDSYNFSFSADDLYNFYFNNTHSDKDKVIDFNLKEATIEPPLWLFRLGVISIFILFPIGLILIVLGYLFKKYFKK